MRSRHLAIILSASLALTSMTPLLAQGVLDGSFEAQATGPGLAPPWLVEPGTNVDVLDATLPQAFLPTDGGNYLRIDPGMKGPAVGGHGPHPSGLVGKIFQPFAIPDHEFIALTLDWEWATLESPYGGPNNDFFSVDLLDPSVSPPALIANIIYIDSGAGMPATYTNVPGGLSGLTYVAADLAWPSSGVPAPAGFKRAWTDLTGLVAPGQPVVLEVTVANGGDTGSPSFALIDNVSLLVAQRSNVGGSLRILGSDHLDGIWALDHGDQHHQEAPLEFFALPGQRVAFRAGGVPGMPWALFAGDLARTGIHFPPVGTVNLSGNLVAVIDGLAPGGGDDLLGTIGANALYSTIGLTRFETNVSPGTPPGTQIAFQGVMLDPMAPAGLSLTAATEIRIGGSGVAPRMPSGNLLVTPANTGGTNLFAGANNDDDATSINLASVGFNGGQWMFFPGTFWNEIWVCDNGYLTLGAADVLEVENQHSMLTGPARIAPLWDDFLPDGIGSTVRFSASPQILTVSWNDLPEFENSSMPANNFAVRLYADGQFTFYYGCTTMDDGLVGISPGNLPSPTPGSFLSHNWSSDSQTAGNLIVIPAGDAVFEPYGFFYNPLGWPYVFLDGFDVFTCGHGSARIHFAPTPSGGYKVFTGTR